MPSPASVTRPAPKKKRVLPVPPKPVPVLPDALTEARIARTREYLQEAAKREAELTAAGCYF